MSTLLGTTLNGRYRLEARIGSGGMSTVYRALDGTLQRQVAIKLMNREITSDSDQLERFWRGKRAVAQLSHPHIVGVIDAGEDDGRPLLSFTYTSRASPSRTKSPAWDASRSPKPSNTSLRSRAPWGRRTLDTSSTGTS